MAAADVELSVGVLFPQLFDDSGFREGHTADYIDEDTLLPGNKKLLCLHV